MGAKWLGQEADHSSPSSVEVKNDWSYASVPSLCLHDLHNDSFTFFNVIHFLCALPLYKNFSLPSCCVQNM